MKNLIWLVSLMFGLNVLFAGCDRRGQSGTHTTPSPSTAPSTWKLSDSDLENAVRAKLETDARLKEANLSVNAIAERNEMTLSGTVRSVLALERAIELAKSAKSRVLVNDNASSGQR